MRVVQVQENKQLAIRLYDVTVNGKPPRATATQFKTDAGLMESYTRSNLSWQSHASQITQIKEHINKAGSIVSQMQSARSDAKPWHQEAIDEITPVLKDLASNTEDVINRLNANPKNLKTPDYQAYLKTNAQLAAELERVIADTVDADNTRAKIEELKAKLGEK